MLENHAKLLGLIQHAGVVTGRKKLQKILYILKKLDYPFQEKFQFHFYGPYSEELTLQIEELCNLNMLSEVKEEKGGYHQYRFTLTEEGERFLKHFDTKMPSIDTLVETLNEQNARFLELVSTVFYFDDLPKDPLVEKVKIVKQKQNYSDDEIGEAIRFIEKLQNERGKHMLEM